MPAKRLRIVKERKPIPKKWLLIIALCAVVGAVAIIWWYDAGAPRRPHTVEIALRDENGAPLEGALVTGLIDTANLPAPKWREKLTSVGDDGKYRFAGVLPGSYWLRAGDGLCVVNIPSTSPGMLKITAVPVTEPYTVSLRVTTPDGQPAAGLPVTEYAFGMEDRAAPASGAGETDWQGAYIWNGLPAGVHRLDIGGATYPLAVEPDVNHSLSVSITWYPPQDIVREIHFQKGNGSPLADEPVALVAYGVPGGKEILLEEWATDSAGQFTFRTQTPAAYTLRVRGRRLKLAALPDGPEKVTYTP